MNRATILFAACLAAWLWPGALRVQAGAQESSSKKPKGVQPAPPPAADGSDAISRRINNSAPAEHDVEVGMYYLKKEKYDAAIDRFKEATQLMPGYGLPYKLMGDAYEKKKFLPEARQSYQKYLTCKISSKDAGEIRKRVAKLDAEIQDQERQRQAATKP